MLLYSRCAAFVHAAAVLLILLALGHCQPDLKLSDFKHPDLKLDDLINLGRDCALCKKFINFAANQSATGPSQAFLDHYAAVISGQLLLTEKTPAKALLAGAQLFQSARQYVRTIAANSTGQPNILTAIVNSDFYALNQQIGDQLASHLPEKFGLDHFKNNFSQAVLPGLVTGLTGFSYAPCLFNNGAVGAIAGATGIGISPKIFNYGPSGGAVVAQGVAISPSLLYISESGSAGIAIGANVSPSLITIGPTRYIKARVGVSAGKTGLSVGFEASPAPAPGPGGAPTPAPAPNPPP